MKKSHPAWACVVLQSRIGLAVECEPRERAGLISQRAEILRDPDDLAILAVDLRLQIRESVAPLEKLREFGVQNFMGAHCTGIEATYKIRDLIGLTRQTAVVGAVGAEFKLGSPMNPGSIAK